MVVCVFEKTDDDNAGLGPLVLFRLLLEYKLTKKIERNYSLLVLVHFKLRVSVLTKVYLTQVAAASNQESIFTTKRANTTGQDEPK